MSKASILIVEDEAIIAADLAGRLRKLDYEIVGIVAEGEEAVATACRLCPQLVLMDIRLEGAMDGIEATEAIRRQHDLPVIYLTAHCDPATLERAGIDCPFGYIRKPFDERELALQVHLALSKHQAAQQLRQQREWLRVTLNSIGEAVIATDAEGRIVFINLVAESLTGWKAEEASGQPVREVFRIVHDQTGQTLQQVISPVLREGRVVKLSNPAALVTKDGRKVPIEDTAVPLLDAVGQVIGAVLVFQDVTEKRRADELLRQSEQRYRVVADFTFDWEFWLTPEGRFQYVSPSAERITGRQVTPGSNAVDFFRGVVHPDDLPRRCEHLQEELRDQLPGEMEFRIVRPDGEVRWIHHRCQPVHDETGRFLGTRGSNRDITQRKLTEELLVQAKAVNAARDQLLAHVSPELGTSIDAISGLIDAARSQSSDPTVQDCLQTAKGSVDRHLTLLNELRDLVSKT
ncbi:MAG: PAS domain S-box protein [Pirellulaceae bacterium]